jgi:hypothetical protein
MIMDVESVRTDIILLLSFFLLQVLDVITTLIFTSNGINEVNPITLLSWSFVGMNYSILFKVMIFPVILILFSLFVRIVIEGSPNKVEKETCLKIEKGCLIFMVMFYLFIVFLNVSVIL